MDSWLGVQVCRLSSLLDVVVLVLEDDLLIYTCVYI